MLPNFRISLALITTLLLLPAWSSAQSVAQLTVGKFHFCTLDDTGIVSCTTSSSATRLLEPEGLPAFSQIAAGESHTCGITLDGGAVCWGDNYHNQLDVPSLDTPLVSLSAGFNHTCAVDTNGEAICWGLNTNLQLEPPTDAGTFIKVDGTRNYSCGIVANGDLHCWSTDGEISRDSVTPGPFVDLDSSANERCGLTVNGDITCSRYFVTPENGPYMDLAVGPLSVCGLTQDGRLDCEIRFGVGDDIVSEVNSASESVRFTAIESGHTNIGGRIWEVPICGIRADNGSVMCFGSNELPASADAGVTTSTSAENIELSLSALAYSESTIELFWNLQPNQLPPVLIEVYRDGELLATTDAMFSYFDSDSVTQSESTYSIRAIDQAGRTGPFSNDVTVSRENISNTDSGIDAELVNPRIDSGVRIENLRVLAPGFFLGNLTGTAILTWELVNETNVAIAGFEVRRNNSSLAFTRNMVYVNNTVTSNFCGTFSVLAIGDDGQILETSSVPLIFENIRSCR